MPIEDHLRQIVEKTEPSAVLRRRAKQHLLQSIRPQGLLRSVETVRPSVGTASALRRRILQMIHPEAAQRLEDFSLRTDVHPTAVARMKDNILSRLQPAVEASLVHSGFKWTAAFVLTLLIIRSMPLILLAPPTKAETVVQLLPAGSQVSVYIGGVWQDVTGPQTLRGPAMVSTGNARATIVLNDDGVLRLAPNTTVKIHRTEDHPASTEGTTATLVHGQVWVLGLLPPVIDGLSLETSQGTMSFTSGSASVSQSDAAVDVAVYDKGVTFTQQKQTVFLVSGERVNVRGGQISGIITLPTKAYTDLWVSENLSQDAVHRAEIAKLQEERRSEVAGILPTSFFYPAKRIAEEVDVLFTLTHDGRAGKRIEQANTRLSEALALMKQGENAAASEPLSEYSASLVALAADQGDNLVKDLIRQHIAEASASLSTPSKDPQLSVRMLSDAVEKIGTAVPDVHVSTKDIQGYVLVDKLAEINKVLSLDHDASAAAVSYTEVQPYLQALLADNAGVNPLLQREARALLVGTSVLLKDGENTPDTDVKVIAAMAGDIEKYLPVEQQSIEELNRELDAQVQSIRGLIIKFDSPVSRYNELMHQMDLIISDHTNPNRGLLLRKLKAALPVALGEYVNLGIKQLSDELNQH